MPRSYLLGADPICISKFKTKQVHANHTEREFVVTMNK